MVFQCVDIATKPHNLPLFKPAPEDIFPLVDAVSPNVPRFEPAPEDIVPLVDAISETFRVYQALSDPAEKAKALKRLASVAQALHSETNSPVDATEQSMNYTFATSAVRIAMAMGVFQKLPDRGSLTVQEMAAAAHADTDLMLRVLRALASVNVLKQVDLDSYAHTSMSRIWSSGHARASFRFKDEVYLTQSKLSAYFDERGFKNVTDHLDTPWGYARGVKGVDPFTLLARYPESHKAFNEAMVVDTELAARELCDTFPFDSLAPGESDVVLVDVGGGKGQTMAHVLKTFPGLRGRVVLEDLASVLHGERLMVEDERLQVQAYDFLSEEQPIKGIVFPRHGRSDPKTDADLPSLPRRGRVLLQVDLPRLARQHEPHDPEAHGAGDARPRVVALAHLRLRRAGPQPSAAQDAARHQHAAVLGHGAQLQAVGPAPEAGRFQDRPRARSRQYREQHHRGQVGGVAPASGYEARLGRAYGPSFVGRASFSYTRSSGWMGWWMDQALRIMCHAPIITRAMGGYYPCPHTLSHGGVFISPMYVSPT